MRYKYKHPLRPVRFLDLFGLGDLLWLIQKRWHKVFCRHPAMGVIRYNAEVVPEVWAGRQLYVDIHGCHCFVQCWTCGRIFKGEQREHLYGQRQERW